jgi:hypothetical protein
MNPSLMAEPSQMMQDLLQQYPAAFPLFFIVMWLGATSLLGLISGWYFLAARFPDQPEEPLFRLNGLSGSMGLGVSFSRILTISVCRSGLRIAMWRVFGPFCRPFFVPWGSLTVTRKTVLFMPVVRLGFDDVPLGRLTIARSAANRLARAAGEDWPERSPIPNPTAGEVARLLLIQWALATGLAATFFTVAPRLLSPRALHVPLAVTVLFPGIVFGIGAVITFFQETPGGGGR